MSVDVSQINTKLTLCGHLSDRYWCTAGSARQRRANCGEETLCVVMTEICGLSPELRAYWSQLTWRDWDLQCWRVLSSFLFLQGSLKSCFHTIAEKKNSDRSDHMETILYNRSDSSDNDRWKSNLSGSLRSLESGFHMIATITELFFFSDQKENQA